MLLVLCETSCRQLTRILPEETTRSIAIDMEIDEIDEDTASLVLALNRLKLADSLVYMTAEEYVEVDEGLISTSLPT